MSGGFRPYLFEARPKTVCREIIRMGVSEREGFFRVRGVGIALRRSVWFLRCFTLLIPLVVLGEGTKRVVTPQNVLFEVRRFRRQGD